MAMFSNLFRIVLVLASFVSFLPQLHRILSRKDCDGISAVYILLNLIVATEQFSILLHYHVAEECRLSNIVASPATAGDWINLSQLAVVCVLHLFLFGLYLLYSQLPVIRKIVLATAYAAFLLISIAPIIFEATLPAEGDSVLKDRRGFSVIYRMLHARIIHPIVTFLGIAALWPQLRQISTNPGALSVKTLGLQAVVFLIVGVSWDYRITIDFGRLRDWYEWVGWAPLDNIAFALVQGILWWFARRAAGIHVHYKQTGMVPLLG